MDFLTPMAPGSEAMLADSLSDTAILVSLAVSKATAMRSSISVCLGSFSFLVDSTLSSMSFCMRGGRFLNPSFSPVVGLVSAIPFSLRTSGVSRSRASLNVSGEVRKPPNEKFMVRGFSPSSPPWMMNGSADLPMCLAASARLSTSSYLRALTLPRVAPSITAPAMLAPTAPRPAQKASSGLSLRSVDISLLKSPPAATSARAVMPCMIDRTWPPTPIQSPLI